MSINISYVMEFFLQTLVKKVKMPQQTMLLLQRILMSISTLVAVVLIYYYVNPFISFFSLVLNFNNRKYEMTNFCISLIFALVLYLYIYPQLI